MNKPLLSVIMPIYNVEEYVVEAVDSVLNEGYGNTELILVNDGSSDGSLKVIERYSSDDRVVIVDKPNGGLSDARNAGMAVAKGEFLTFIDGDDVIATDTYKDAVTYLLKADDVDIVQFPILWRWTTGRDFVKKCDLKSKLYSAENGRGDMFLDLIAVDINPSVCSKVFRRSAVAGLKFEDATTSEDQLFTSKVLLGCKGLYRSSVGLYYYRTRAGSIMNSERAAIFYKDWARAARCQADCALEAAVDSGIVERYLLKCYIFLKWNTRQYSVEDREEIFSILFKDDAQRRRIACKSVWHYSNISKVLSNLISLTNECVGAERHKVLRIFGCKVWSKLKR